MYFWSYSFPSPKSFQVLPSSLPTQIHILVFFIFLLQTKQTKTPTKHDNQKQPINRVLWWKITTAIQEAPTKWGVPFPPAHAARPCVQLAESVSLHWDMDFPFSGSRWWLQVASCQGWDCVFKSPSPCWDLCHFFPPCFVARGPCWSHAGSVAEGDLECLIFLLWVQGCTTRPSRVSCLQDTNFVSDT